MGIHYTDCSKLYGSKLLVYEGMNGSLMICDGIDIRPNEPFKK